MTGWARVTDLSRRATTWLQRHPVAADTGLALLLAASAVVSVESLYREIEGIVDPSFHPPSKTAAIGWVLAVALPLALRRRFPLSVAGVCTTAFVVAASWFEVPETAVGSLVLALAYYSAAVHGRPRARTVVLVLCLVGLLGEVARQLFVVGSAEGLALLSQAFLLAYNAAFFALPCVLGTAIRRLRAREHELADRATELQREREENARQAVFAERVRIARELHDVVAHHVSVMGVQAGAARSVMARQPEKATEALASIEVSSRQALLEMDRLLGFLRSADEVDELAPQPGLHQLDELVAQAAEGALAVDLTVHGDRRPLSPTLEVSAYRIVQEALTNVRKHSDSRRATVLVRYGPSTLEIEVVDEGGPVAAGPVGAVGGHGLIGMRERASLHGGHVSAGHRPDGGFGVVATFPLDGSRA